jgi:hypothetical protein
MSDRPEETPPQDPDARIEWILNRAQKLDLVRHEDWIADELEYLWNNPDEFEAANTHETPTGVDPKDYALFRLGVLFGTDYEHYFPRGDDDG